MRQGYAVAAIWDVLALAGCSQDTSAPAPSTVAPKPKAAPVKKGPSVDELTTGMALAPALGKSVLPLDLKFELSEKPKIGQPLEINLAVIPQIAGGPAEIQLGQSDGVDAAQGESQYEIANVESGEVYRHTVHVTPTTDGVLLVNVTVSLNHDDVTDSRAFSIPVIVDR